MARQVSVCLKSASKTKVLGIRLHPRYTLKRTFNVLCFLRTVISLPQELKTVPSLGSIPEQILLFVKKFASSVTIILNRDCFFQLL